MFNLNDIPLCHITSGITENENEFICIYCGEKFEKGEVFKIGDRFFTSQKAAEIHCDLHTDKLERLFAHCEKNLTFTDNQKKLLALFSMGKSDTETAKILGVAPSTVRHQKFMFRERAKEAKMFLAVWNIACGGKEGTNNDEFLEVHQGATMVDDRFIITKEEEDRILENVFISQNPLRLKVFSKKEKKKIVILKKVAQQFEENRKYSEKEVNTILKDIWGDFATMRRYLIEYGYLDRTKDGKEYWKK